LNFKDWKNLLEFIPLHFCPYGQKWSGEFARKNKKILSLLWRGRIKVGGGQRT